MSSGPRRGLSRKWPTHRHSCADPSTAPFTCPATPATTTCAVRSTRRSTRGPAIVAEAAGAARRPGSGDRRPRGRACRSPCRRPATAPTSPSDGGILLKTPRWPRSWSTPTAGSPGSARARAGARCWPPPRRSAWRRCRLVAATSASPGYTLGGGVGWLSRRYGFAADSVCAPRSSPPTAARHRRAPEQHPDLFWALRGGGGNFGVVTVAGVPAVPGRARSTPASPTSPSSARRETLAGYRDWAATAPDELSTAVVLDPRRPSPGRARRRVLAIKVMYAGAADGPSTCSSRCARPPGRRCVDELARGAVRRRRDGRHRRPAPRPASSAAGRGDRRPRRGAATTGSRRPSRSGTGAARWPRPAPDAGPVGHRDAPFSVIVDAADPALADDAAPARAPAARSSTSWPTPPGPPTRVHGRRLRAAERGEGRLRPRRRLPPQPPAAGGRRAGPGRARRVGCGQAVSPRYMVIETFTRGAGRRLRARRQARPHAAARARPTSTAGSTSAPSTAAFS